MIEPAKDKLPKSFQLLRTYKDLKKKVQEIPKNFFKNYELVQISLA